MDVRHVSSARRETQKQPSSSSATNRHQLQTVKVAADNRRHFSSSAEDAALYILIIIIINGKRSRSSHAKAQLACLVTCPTINNHPNSVSKEFLNTFKQNFANYWTEQML